MEGQKPNRPNSRGWAWPKKEEESEEACYAKGSTLGEILRRPKLTASPDARI